jgi:hypothetical protein
MFSLNFFLLFFFINYFQKLNSLSETDKSKINKLNDIPADLEKENMSTILDYKMTNQEIFKAIKKLKNCI